MGTQSTWGVIPSFLHRMPAVWIRNDFLHHVWTKISKDKVLFNKEKNKHAIGGEANVDVGVEPFNVGFGAAFIKKQADEREGLLYQDIKEAGFTRLDKGTAQTKDFNYKVDGNNYLTIIVHTGNWNFDLRMDNEELGNKNKYIRINKGGAIVDANWTHKYLNFRKEKYAEEYSLPPPIPVERKLLNWEIAKNSYNPAIGKLVSRMNSEEIDFDLLDVALTEVIEKWETLKQAHKDLEKSKFKMSVLSAQKIKEIEEEWVNMTIKHEDMLKQAERMKLQHPIRLENKITMGESELNIKEADIMQLYKNCLEEWKQLDDNMEKIDKFKVVITKWEDFETAHNLAMFSDENTKNNEDFEMLAKDFKNLFSYIQKSSEDTKEAH